MNIRRLAAALVLPLLLAGCMTHPATITNLPAGVSQKEVQAWQSAIEQLQIISDASHSATTTVIALNKSGTLPDGAAYVAALRSLGKIKQLQLSANNILSNAPQQFGQPIAGQAFAFADQILAEAKTISGAGLPPSVITLVSTIQLAANTILALKGVL